MQAMTLGSFGMLIGFIVLSSCGQICMKIGLGGETIPVSSSPFRTILNILTFMMRPWTFAGLSLYVLGAFVWLMLLSQVSLSIAYPMVSLGYGLVMVLSVLVLREKVRWKYGVVGLVFIAVGVSCIGLGMG